MASLRLRIEDGNLVDVHGRQITLRGINVAGEAKYPNEPELPSHIVQDFFDGDKVKFSERPFPLQEAHLHFSRLKRYGYNTIRYVFTWEAIEAKGPGIYDEAWIRHTIDILRLAKGFGFYVFMDPHQDVWSRFSGGSGAPMWTLYACGLNPQGFAATEAAIVHNTYPDTARFPKMIWSTNYYRLAAATMFSLFFGGRDFAPKCIIDGQNIQDYLQGHFCRAVGHLAKRIHEAGDIENEVVFGWESLNEPNKGMLGYVDISVIPADQHLRKGTCPTIWQTMLAGSGKAVEVDTFDMGSMGPYKAGRALIDPQGESAWLAADYDDSRYGYTRDAGWKMGQCVWEQHGVWDSATDILLKKDYFANNPKTGQPLTYEHFTDTYFMDFFRGYRDTVRAHHEDAIILLQGPTMELPPRIKGTADDEPGKLIYATHWYDGLTLMTKKWNASWNVDVIGILRGRYWHPAFAIKLGETAIRNCFRDQFTTIKKEGLGRMGRHPCVMTEFGIPYDMDEKHAYKTGDYSSQVSAMDANHFAAEALDGYTLWLYMAKNDHERGDQWNGEDLSIFSADDKELPLSPLYQRPDCNQPTNSLLLKRADTAATWTTAPRGLEDDLSVMPSSLEHTLKKPSISSAPYRRGHPMPMAKLGYRAAEAVVRPAPVATAGRVVEYSFNLRTADFTLSLDADKGAARQDAPTTVFLPEYHFPREGCVVDVSSGKFEIHAEAATAMAGDEGGASAMVPMLSWWHDEGLQTLKVKGGVKTAAEADGTGAEDGYVDQYMGMLENCRVL